MAGRKVMCRVVALLLVFLFVSSTLAHAWYPYSDKYNDWQADRPFVIGALHNSLPEDHLVERMARFRAAGLNTVIWWKPGNSHHVFEAAHEAGLQWACGSRGGLGVVDEAMKIPGCSFVFAGDEPGDDLAPVAQFSEQFRQAHPDVPVFANLSIGKTDHDAYIEQCEPDIFSFDMYPLYRDGTEHEKYLHHVNWARDTSRKYRLPYWMFLQAYGREHERRRYAYRIPDEADLRYLVFSFLAHGGTGIMFFHYYGHPEGMVMDRGVENPARGPVETHRYENTETSRAWFAVRDVAPEVQTISRALVNLRTKDEIGYAGAVPSDCAAFEGHGALKSVLVGRDPGSSALVGFFDDEQNEEYFMVVNLVHGLNRAKMDGMRRLRLVFSGSVEQIERLNRLTGLVETLRTESGSSGTRVLDIQLEGGTGDLFKWSNGNPWTIKEQ